MLQGVLQLKNCRKRMYFSIHPDKNSRKGHFSKFREEENYLMWGGVGISPCFGPLINTLSCRIGSFKNKFGMFLYLIVLKNHEISSKLNIR